MTQSDRPFSVKKKFLLLTSKNQTVILADNALDENRLKDVICQTGYTVTEISCEPYEKKSFFHRK